MSRCICYVPFSCFAFSTRFSFWFVAPLGRGFLCLVRQYMNATIWYCVWFSLLQVYVLHKEAKGSPKALGVLKGHVQLGPNLPLSTVEVKNATIDMQGSYSCHVITQNGKSQNEAFLNVIQGIYAVLRCAFYFPFGSIFLLLSGTKRTKCV